MLVDDKAAEAEFPSLARPRAGNWETREREIHRPLTYDDLVALSGGACTANLPPSFPVAIDIISRASLHPKSVDESGWGFEDQLRDEGFSESEIDELLAVGFFSVMMNMLTDVYDVPWEIPFPPPST